MDQDGYLDHNEIRKACKDTGYSDNYDEIRATLKDVSTNTVGKIDVEEFIEVIYYRAWIHLKDAFKGVILLPRKQI